MSIHLISKGKNIYVSTAAQASSIGNNPRDPTTLKDALTRLDSGDILYLKNGEIYSLQSPASIVLKDKTNVKITNYTTDPKITDKPMLTQAFKVRDDIPINFCPKWGLTEVDLSSIMTDDNNNRVWGLWINGVRYMVARYPNLVDPNKLYGADPSEFIFLNQSESTSSEIYPPRGLKNLGSQYWTGATVKKRTTNWRYHRFDIINETINSNGDFTFALDHAVDYFDNLFKSRAFLHRTEGFFIENIFAELDSPGEYYYDRDERKLYYQECPPSLCPISSKSYDQGIWILAHGNNFDDADQITKANTEEDYYLNGLDTMYLNQDGETNQQSSNIIKASGSILSVDSIAFSKAFTSIFSNQSNVQVKNCEFSDHLASAVYFADKRNAGYVLNSVFNRIDFNGIVAKYAIVTVDNVQMTDIALPAGYAYQGAGVVCLYSGCTVTNSKFKNMGYSGIACYYAGCKFQYNTIENWQLTLMDTGAIYSMKSRGTVIDSNTVTGLNYWNYISLNKQTGPGATVYLDMYEIPAGTYEFGQNVTNNILLADTAFCLRINAGNGHFIDNNRCENGFYSNNHMENTKITNNIFNVYNRTDFPPARAYGLFNVTFSNNLIYLKACARNMNSTEITTLAGRFTTLSKNGANNKFICGTNVNLDGKLNVIPT